MTAYYNENDHFAAQWLCELIRSGHLPAGTVDERSIEDVRPEDLRGFDQCHFFAGIGGWAYALRLAGWADGRPCWTGSCPCQPFSAAGKRGGFADKRHLWPVWWRLIRECRPVVVLGEQVASRAALTWFDAVCDDLEGAGYAVGAADLCAAGVGAPHIRQRLFWVADRADADGRPGECRAQEGTGTPGFGRRGSTGNSTAGGLADRCGQGFQGRPEQPTREECSPIERGGVSCGVGDVLGESVRGGSQGHGEEESQDAGEARQQRIRSDDGESGATRGFWHPADWIPCADGKARPVEPGTFPLAHGVPARVGRLRGYGNACVPPLAAEFVKAFM